MAIALIAFAIVFALVMGVYYMLIARPEQSARAALQRRLKAGPGSNVPLGDDLLKQARRMSDIKALNAILAGSTGFAVPLQHLLDRAGLKLNVGRFLLISALCAAVPAAVARRFGVDLPLALLLAAVFAFLPYWFVKRKAAVRMHRFEELFPEAMDLLARALRAGHAFTTALAMVSEEVADPVGPEFRLLYDQQNFGMPLPEAMRSLAERVNLLDVRIFVTAVLTQREAGGNLSEVLDNLSAVVRDRFKVKRQIRVVTAHARITGWVLALLPPAAALAMLFIGPEHIKVLVTDPIGIRMVVVGVVLQVLGTLIIRRLVEVEY